MTGNVEYRLSVLLTVFGTIAACLVLRAAGMTVPIRTFVAGSAIPALLFILHHYYGRSRRSDNLHLLTGSTALLLWSAAAAAIVAHAGMRLRMPLIDSFLAASDRAIGLDTGALVQVTAAHPRFAQALGAIYITAVPAVLLSVIGLSLLGRTQRVWTLIYGYSSGLLLAALISVLWPALANFAYARFTPSETAGLPRWAGTFFLPSVQYFRDGADPVVDPAHFNGVVTFPSFHAIMALIVAHALRGAGLFSWAIYIWAGLLIVSTVPIGGHYVIDILGGGALWLACLLLARTLNAWRPLRPASIITGT